MKSVVDLIETNNVMIVRTFAINNKSILKELAGFEGTSQLVRNYVRNTPRMRISRKDKYWKPLKIFKKDKKPNV